jgi:hypothetical protein
MALQKTIAANTGFTAPSAYGRVVELTYARNKTSAKLYWYKDQNAADRSVKISQDTVEFSASLDGDNLVAQAYVAFKGLEHLSDAEDV